MNPIKVAALDTMIDLQPSILVPQVGCNKNGSEFCSVLRIGRSYLLISILSSTQGQSMDRKRLCLLSLRTGKVQILHLFKTPLNQPPLLFPFFFPCLSLCWCCQNTEMRSSLFTTRLFAGWTRWSTQWSPILVTKPIHRAGLWGRLRRKWCFPLTSPTTPTSSSTTALLSGQSRQSIMAILAGSGGIIFFPE